MWCGLAVETKTASLRGKARTPSGPKWQSPEIHKVSTWILCGVKPAPQTSEPFDEASARILSEVNPAPRTSEPFDEDSARIFCAR